VHHVVAVIVWIDAIVHEPVLIVTILVSMLSLVNTEHILLALTINKIKMGFCPPI